MSRGYGSAGTDGNNPIRPELVPSATNGNLAYSSGTVSKSPIPSSLAEWLFHGLKIEGLTKDCRAGSGDKDRLGALFARGPGDVVVRLIQNGRAVFGIVCITGDEVDEVQLEQVAGNMPGRPAEAP